MYSSTISARKIEHIESSKGIKFHRYTPTQSLDLAAYISERHAQGQVLDSNNNYIRKADAEFVWNERYLCQLDFRYFTRYCQIIRDGSVGGGIGSLDLWESQEILLNLLARTEESNVETHERYCFKDVASCLCDGICIVDNKGGRQLGHTAVSRALTWHRVMLYPHTRAAAVSVDDDKLHKMVEADELIYNNLPFFLKPEIVYREKEQHFNFNIGSSLIYQTSEQKSGSGATVGIGTGGQFDISHLTEVSSYRYAHMLELDFFPTLPRNPYTLCIMETTPLGRGNWWHEFSEKVRNHKIPRWRYLYIPFYAEPKKYRAHAPENWQPDETTKVMASNVYETSEEFTGKKVTLSREQMYWWEQQYRGALEGGRLNLFLSNYSITPQQSFQHTTVSAVSVDVLDWMRSTTRKGATYVMDGL